jgi:HEAT repeat protein
MAAKMQDQTSLDPRAKAAAERLTQAGFGADRDGVLRALHSDDLAIRGEAAALAGWMPVLADELKQALHDPQARVRVEAAMSLARLGDTDLAMQTLRAELSGAFFADAPLRAARGLALLGDTSGYARVLEALHSDLPSNRMEAVQALQAFLPLASAGVDPIAALIDATSDSEAIVRADAIAALRGLDDPRATETLRKVDEQ